MRRRRGGRTRSAAAGRAGPARIRAGAVPHGQCPLAQSVPPPPDIRPARASVPEPCEDTGRSPRRAGLSPSACRTVACSTCPPARRLPGPLGRRDDRRARLGARSASAPPRDCAACVECGGDPARRGAPRPTATGCCSATSRGSSAGASASVWSDRTAPARPRYSASSPARSRPTRARSAFRRAREIGICLRRPLETLEGSTVLGLTCSFGFRRGPRDRGGDRGGSKN